MRPRKNDYALVNNIGCWIAGARKKATVEVTTGGCKDAGAHLPASMEVPRSDLTYDALRRAWVTSWPPPSTRRFLLLGRGLQVLQWVRTRGLKKDRWKMVRSPATFLGLDPERWVFVVVRSDRMPGFLDKAVLMLRERGFREAHGV